MNNSFEFLSHLASSAGEGIFCPSRFRIGARDFRAPTPSDPVSLREIMVGQISALTEVIALATNRRSYFLGRHLKKEPTPPDPRCCGRHLLVTGRIFWSTPGL